MGIARKVDGVWLIRDEMDVNRWDLEGTIEEVIACLNLIKEKAVSLGMTDEGRLDFEAGSDFYGGYELRVKYYFDRSENDKERALREKAEAAEKDRKAKDRKKAAEKRKMKADAEYAEYERLKAKFEVEGTK
jgi:hypothetical protein